MGKAWLQVPSHDPDTGISDSVSSFLFLLLADPCAEAMGACAAVSVAVPESQP